MRGIWWERREGGREGRVSNTVGFCVNGNIEKIFEVPDIRPAFANKSTNGQRGKID